MPLSNKTKELLRIKHTGKILTEEHRLKISRGLKGHIVNNDTKRKQSIVRKGIKFNSDTITKMSIAKKGKPWTEKRR